jgi:hypothetical protein
VLIDVFIRETRGLSDDRVDAVAAARYRVENGAVATPPQLSRETRLRPRRRAVAATRSHEDAIAATHQVQTPT